MSTDKGAKDSKGSSSDSVSISCKSTSDDDSDLDTDLTPQTVRALGYEIGEKIGSGAFSNVHKAIRKKAGEPALDLAVKLIRFDKVEPDWKGKGLKSELKITKKLNHPNIVKVHEVIKTKRRAFIFMDLARGSLEDQLKKSPNGFPEKTARLWFGQLAKAINYMHDKGVAHRDLKTENVLLDAQLNVKLADFGFACFCFDRETHSEVLA